MNLKSINNEVILLVLAFLIGLTLLFKDQLSTIIILVFVAFFLFINFNKEKKPSRYFYIFLIPSLLVIPRVFGFFTGDLRIAGKELIRALPLIILFVPFFLFGSKKIKEPEKLEIYFFYGILASLGLFMLICNYLAVSQIITKQEPLSYLFRWRYMNMNFSKPLGVHPPYVGLIAVYALIKTNYHHGFSTFFKLIITSLIVFLLIQLLARNALMVSVFVIIFTAVKKGNFKVLIVSTLLVILLAFLVLNSPNPYLKKKLFSRLNFTNKEQFDKRLVRIEPSYYVFKRAPIFGVGPGNDDRLRKQQYKRLNFYTAYKYNFNSHNQFMEYLVSSGLVGFALFVIVLVLLWQCSKGSEFSYKLIIIAFILSCLTESVLERTLGIKYFALMSCFVITSFFCKKQRLIHNEI